MGSTADLSMRSVCRKSVIAALTFAACLLISPAGQAAKINSIAPEQSSVVEIPFAAAPGDRFLVYYNLSWDQHSKGEAPFQITMNSTEQGEFLKQRSDGYTVRWTTQDFSVSTRDNPSNLESIVAKSFKALVEEDPNKQLEFYANPAGRPTHVPEWQAINAYITKFIKDRFPEIVREVVPQLAKQIDAQGRMARLTAALLAKVGGITFEHGKDTADAFEAARLMAATQNIGLPRFGKFEWKRSAPILGNKDKTKSTTMVWFESFSRQFDFAEIRWRTEFDQADLKNTSDYKDRLARILKAEDAEAKVRRLPSIKSNEILNIVSKHLKLERTDTGFAKVRISDGWTQEATYESHSVWSIRGARESEIYKHRIVVKRLPPG